VNRTDNDDNMGLLTAQLISLTDEEQVYGAFRDGLPQVGVSTCNVTLFEAQEGDPVAGSLAQPLEPGAVSGQGAGAQPDGGLRGMDDEGRAREEPAEDGRRGRGKTAQDVRR